MISLNSNYLLFQLASGEQIPFSADMIQVEIQGDTRGILDPDMLHHAAASVFHYFKAELERETVTLREFSGALEKVLCDLGLEVHPATAPDGRADLRLLAHEAGDSRELFFFPRLRDELRLQLRQSPRRVHFCGLRDCAKQLAGARRWGPRCEDIRDQIVEFLRGCLSAESSLTECALVVE